MECSNILELFVRNEYLIVNKRKDRLTSDLNCSELAEELLALLHNYTVDDSVVDKYKWMRKDFEILLKDNPKELEAFIFNAVRDFDEGPPTEKRLLDLLMTLLCGFMCYCDNIEITKNILHTGRRLLCNSKLYNMGRCPRG